MNMHEFLTIEYEDLASKFEITQSLLKERFFVFQRFLRILDNWWDRGLRPSDPFSTTFRLLVEKLGNVNYGNSSKDLIIYDDDINFNINSCSDKHVSVIGNKRNNNYNNNNNNNTYTNTNINKINNKNNSSTKNINDRISGEIEIVRLSDPSSLLSAWSPINRAYGWNVPLSVLTAVSTGIGGTVLSVLYCFVLDSIVTCCVVLHYIVLHGICVVHFLYFYCISICICIVLCNIVLYCIVL